MSHEIVFCTSCRIALGKLRRVTNVAKALHDLRRDIKLSLLVYAGSDQLPKGLNEDELALYDRIESVRPAEMAHRMESMNVDVVVVGNTILRDLHKVDASLCLILREVLPEELQNFRLEGGRPWDLVILPNPERHWMPDPNIISARRIESVGWIYRSPDPTAWEKKRDDRESSSILITTGGGSGDDRGNDLRSEIAYLIAELHKRLKIPVKIIQVIGPNDWKQECIEGVDEMISPGPELHNLFRSADLVMSAAGYNTVLELACTDVPVLLIPAARYTDDQEKRAVFWGKSLGMCHAPNQKEVSISWMTDILNHKLRRPLADIGPSGADRSAELIVDLLK